MRRRPTDIINWLELIAQLSFLRIKLNVGCALFGALFTLKHFGMPINSITVLFVIKKTKGSSWQFFRMKKWKNIAWKLIDENQYRLVDWFQAHPHMIWWAQGSRFEFSLCICINILLWVSSMGLILDHMDFNEIY